MKVKARKMKKYLLSSLRNYKFERLFLAAKESSCPFKKDNNVSCDGKARLGKIANYQQTETTKYFIGCDKYKQNEKWHRFINIKPEETNISLLQQLFSGTASVTKKHQIISDTRIITMQYDNSKEFLKTLIFNFIKIKICHIQIMELLFVVK
uniref:Uncharacterized protein n=1 Tax=Rhizophagus irregularis (strain DAOM 181602 / DAOM 197198 / MUCL 43194) TaxID=747089 RepID=U9TK34_RHIID